MLSDPYLVALHEVVQSAARQSDRRATLSLVASKAKALTGAATAAVMLLDESRRLLDFAAVAGADSVLMLGQRVLVDDAMAGHTALTGELTLINNEADSQQLFASFREELSLGVRSAAVVPIYVAGRPVGALAAINRDDLNSFSGDDILKLQVLAGGAALAEGMDLLRREARSKQRERDILYESARATSSSLNVQEILHNLLGTLGDSLEMAVGAVFLMNDERSTLYIGAEVGLEADDRDRQLPTDSGFAAYILRSGQPRVIQDLLTEATEDDFPFPDIRSVLAASIVSRSQPEGIIVIGSRQLGAYRAEDGQLLSAVGRQAAVALENAWLYEDANRRAQEATAIYELSQTVSATLKLDRMFQFVADSVISLLQVDKFALFLFDTSASSLEIKIARNLREETVRAMRPRIGEGIAGWVMEFETPTAVQDVAADHRNRSCPIHTEDVTSLVSVPLQSGDQVIGVLHAMSSRRRLFTVGEMELLYTIANQVGAAISNARMYAGARQKSVELRKYVRRVARAVGSSLASNETAQVITDVAIELTNADRSVLYTVDSAGRLFPRAATNVRGILTIPGLDLSVTPADWVARRRRALTLEDLSQDSRFSLPFMASRDRYAGYLGVPVKVGADTLGVLEVYKREPHRFTTEEVRQMLTFATQASVGLQNVLLIEQANERLQELKVLGSLSELLCADLTPRELGEKALSLLARMLGANAAIVCRDAAPGGVSPPPAWTVKQTVDDSPEQGDAVTPDACISPASLTGLETLAPQCMRAPGAREDAAPAEKPGPPGAISPDGLILLNALDGLDLHRAEPPRRLFLMLCRSPRQRPFDFPNRYLLSTFANLLSTCRPLIDQAQAD